MQTDLLQKLRLGEKMNFSQQLSLVAQLSVPAIMAQVSSVVMQYIDASMVGRLGANESASIGLISSSTWLFNGVCAAAVTGFTVLVAQKIGAGNNKQARNTMKQGYVVATTFAILLAFLGAVLSGVLPKWLGGGADIVPDATKYFLVFVLSLPVVQINTMSSGMLQASGNMRLPSILHIVMCGLDVVFNSLLIFPGISIGGFWLPGANLGVMGAALGTAAAQLVTAGLMTYFLLRKSPMLAVRKGEKLHFSTAELIQSAKIAIPVGAEQVIMCGAQMLSTKIIAPLGTIAIAANSFAVTAESLCYMPGYGIANAATTLIGQRVGAGRKKLTRYLGWMTTLMGIGIMLIMGVLMYLAAPVMIGMLSPNAQVVALGTQVLRIEAFAEPLYGASIVASGVFRGAGDTLISSCFNFCSMWFIRLPLAAWWAPKIGLKGVWIAMCIELCVRGIMFLIRLSQKGWSKKVLNEK